MRRKRFRLPDFALNLESFLTQTQLKSQTLAFYKSQRFSATKTLKGGLACVCANWRFWGAFALWCLQAYFPAKDRTALRSRRPGKKWVGFGPPARTRKQKNSSQDRSRNWPRRENREKKLKTRKILIFPGFEFFSRQSQFRDQSRELFFSDFGSEARNPFFTRSAGSQE